ncbi:MAG: GlsB/YeaQ/YmgE family stress response membrane protein [Isosphaeraceae bacterium]
MIGLPSLVYFLLIGLAAGWLAGQLTKGSSFGLINDLIIGVIGSMLGGVLFGLLGLSATGLFGNLVVATVGAIALLYLVRVINQRR